MAERLDPTTESYIVRKRPLLLVAFQLRIDADFPDWVSEAILNEHVGFHPNSIDAIETIFIIRTMDGTSHAKVGDWLIQGIAGEVYPCERRIFDLTYEIVSRCGIGFKR